MRKQLKLLTLLILTYISVQAQIAPSVYYQFDAANPLAPSIGTTNLSGASTYLIQTSGGKVGKYIEWTYAQNGAYLAGEYLNPTTSVSVQFLYKQTYNTDKNTSATFFRSNFMDMYMDYPKLLLYARAAPSTTNVLVVTLDGIGRKSWGYLNDGNWHQIVATYTATTGVLSLYIDGQSPAGFSQTFATVATINKPGSINLNSANNIEQGLLAMDEFAVYLGTLSAGQIQKNYTEMVAGSHYTTALTTAATVESVTASTNATEYVSGTPTAISQLTTYPIPRFKRSNTLHKNFNWADLMYFGGRFQLGVSDATAVTNSTALNTELANNWNYGLFGKVGSDDFANAWKAQGNAAPSKDFNVITFRAQIGSLINNQAQSNVYYLQNSGGSFLLNPNNGQKQWRPTTDPLFYAADGTYQITQFNAFLSGLTRPITTINENGEIIPIIDSTQAAQDPVVTAAKVSSGLSWYDYLGTRYFKLETESYRDSILSIGALSSTVFTEYAVDGSPEARYGWKESRKINTQMRSQYYSTPDLYPRWADNWYFKQGAWHGLHWIYTSRYYELLNNDKLFSPFVAAGWDMTDPTQDLTPAQWMGLLKITSAMGAEFYYTGYFNEAGNYNPPNPPPSNPSWYAWQMAAPSYVQAITSKEEDLLLNGSLMTGDVPLSYSDLYSTGTSKPTYLFYTGDERIPCSIRKHNSSNKYYIAAALMRNDNMTGNTVASKVATISLDGYQIKFNVRQQGSTFHYNNTDILNPVFYQTDGWHEATHYRLWTPDFNIEAEVADVESNITKKTIGNVGRDFTNSSTYVKYTSSGSYTEYDFQPRTVANQYVYIYARSTDTTANIDFTVYLDGVLKGTVACVKNTSFAWYKYNSTDSTQMIFSSLSAASHTLKIIALSNKIEIDKIVISTNPSLYSSSVTACGGGVVVNPTPTSTITYVGSLNFCTGGSINLTANTNQPAATYLWNTGATTQTITASLSGSYLVTVTGDYGIATSSPVIINASVPSQAVILISPTTQICAGQGNYTLTANNAGSYLWNTGAVTQSITTTTNGAYTVTITYAPSCSSKSTPATVTFGDCSCAAPTGLALKPTSTGVALYRTNFSFVWVKATNPESFQVQLIKISNGTSKSYVYSGLSRSATIRWLTPNTAYKIRIRSKCTGGVYSLWTNYVNATTLP